MRRPAEVIGYLRGQVEHGAGHSPLAAVSVLVLLGVLLVQAGTGLFSNDGNFTEGPLARLVSSATGERLSTVHRFGEWALYALVGLHVAAIAYYTTFRKVALVRPMITGDRFDVEAPLGRRRPRDAPACAGASPSRPRPSPRSSSRGSVTVKQTACFMSQRARPSRCAAFNRTPIELVACA